MFVIDCAGLGGQGARQLRCGYGTYVTLTSPLLVRTDALGPAAGLAAAAGDWLSQRSTRWAYFRPCADTLRLMTALVDHGQVTEIAYLKKM